MTIIKISGDKDPYKPPEPEVGGELPPKETDSAVVVDSDVLPAPVAISVRKPSSRSRRCTGLATLLLVISCGVITVVLISGLYLWHQNYGPRGRRGFCGVTYKEGESARVLSESVHLPSDDAEIIEVPRIGHWQRSRVLHDFTFKKTAIEDVEAGRCFIMDLDETVVKPPESVWELIVKLKRGDYMPQEDVVRRTMRVDQGPLSIDELVTFGPWITNACESRASYTLARVDEADRILDREPRDGEDDGIWDRKKRSIRNENILLKTAHFAAGPIIEYNIVQMG